ncbi:MAG: hypothetical protein JW797_03380 [Bradymonadales bacterium]|nr:hypothetical protein [Bradymonadales bacterium]
MTIDGIGGPKGPTGPAGAGRIQPGEGMTPGQKADRVFAGPELSQTPAPEAAQGDTTVTTAVTEVAQAMRAGEIPGIQAAVEVVLDRIVQTRYTAMSPVEQRRFATHLKEILAGDPVAFEQIRTMLQEALDNLDSTR